GGRPQRGSTGSAKPLGDLHVHGEAGVCASSHNASAVVSSSRHPSPRPRRTSAVSPSSARRRTCAQDVLMAGHAPTDLDVMTTRPPRAASVSERTAAPPPPPPPVATRERGFLPFAAPLIGDEEIQEVVDTLRSSWITTGPKAKRFEQEFAAYLGAPAALALNSCTAGLHTALVTLGIGPGAEVITTPMTFAASVNVIEHVGARPVLVDVEPDTLNLDP